MSITGIKSHHPLINISEGIKIYYDPEKNECYSTSKDLQYSSRSTQIINYCNEYLRRGVHINQIFITEKNMYYDKSVPVPEENNKVEDIGTFIRDNSFFILKDDKYEQFEIPKTLLDSIKGFIDECQNTTEDL